MQNLFFLLSKKKDYPKIFCIGYVKTGTSSLYKALKILGFRTVRLLDLKTWHNEGQEQYVKQLPNWNYDAFVDSPMGHGDLFKKIDKAIPNSKFILTQRDKKSWLKSFVNYFEGLDETTNAPQNLEERIKCFEEHNKQVIEYFKDKPSKLLIMNVVDGDGWEKLCRFLDKPIPKKPFPCKNVGKYRKVDP